MKMEAADLPEHLVAIYNIIAFVFRVKTPLPERGSDGFSPNVSNKANTAKRTAIQLQAWTNPGCSRRLRFPEFKTVGT